MIFKKLRRDRRGIIALEAAIIAPMFLLFCVGIFDLGMWSVQTNVLQAGVQAGGLYAQQHGDATSSSIVSVVRNASPMLSNAVVTASLNAGNWVINAHIPYAGVMWVGAFDMTNIFASYNVPQHSS